MDAQGKKMKFKAAISIGKLKNLESCADWISKFIFTNGEI